MASKDNKLIIEYDQYFAYARKKSGVFSVADIVRTTREIRMTDEMCRKIFKREDANSILYMELHTYGVGNDKYFRVKYLSKNDSTYEIKYKQRGSKVHILDDGDDGYSYSSSDDSEYTSY